MKKLILRMLGVTETIENLENDNAKLRRQLEMALNFNEYRDVFGSRTPGDGWQMENVDPPRGISKCDDSNKWAEYFVAVYPDQKHMQKIMATWFANVIMAVCNKHNFKG